MIADTARISLTSCDLNNLRGEKSEHSQSLFLAGLLLGGVRGETAVESLAGEGQDLELSHSHIVLGSFHLNPHHRTQLEITEQEEDVCGIKSNTICRFLR